MRRFQIVVFDPASGWGATEETFETAAEAQTRVEYLNEALDLVAVEGIYYSYVKAD